MLQGLVSRRICLDESHIISQGTGLLHQPAVCPHKDSSSDFLGTGFRSLGAPAITAIHCCKTDEPLPPGIADLTIDPSAQDLQKFLLDHLKIPIQAIRSHEAADLAHGNSSSNFIGHAFKRLGMPICSVIDDHRTDEAQLPGAGGEVKDIVSPTISEFRPLHLGEGIPKQKKFMGFALCRQKLHDDVLREWLSSFHDELHCLLKQRDLVQVIF